MKTGTSHRAILRSGIALILCIFCALCVRASLVTGNVVDVGLASLQTKMMFTPTNSVLVTGGGLSAGPAKTITTTNGAFSVVLDAGCYNVSFPLVPWRKSFQICLTAGVTNNITNFMTTVLVFEMQTEDGVGLLPD